MAAQEHAFVTDQLGKLLQNPVKKKPASYYFSGSVDVANFSIDRQDKEEKEKLQVREQLRQNVTNSRKVHRSLKGTGLGDNICKS